MRHARVWTGLAGLLLLAAPLPAQGGKIKLPVSLGELEKRVRSDSNDPASHYNVALGYWNAKRWDDVERKLRAALALDPRFAEAHLALAYLPAARRPDIWDQMRQKKMPDDVRTLVDQMDREYRHAFVINPMVDLRIIATTQSSPDYWMMHDYVGELATEYIQGITDCMEGNYDSCEQRLTRSITLFQQQGSDAPDNALWYRGLAAAHMQHFDIAATDFRSLIDRDSTRVKKAEQQELVHVTLRTNEYRYFLAVFEQAAGNLADAITLYRAAIENDLGLYEAHVRLAGLFEGQHDYPRAIEERQRAINANPDDASLQMDLGVTLGKAGQFAAAEAALVKATDALPRNSEAWFWLGLAREQLGKKEEARAAYTQVVAVAPSRFKARADQARARLAALQ